jgi:hypothetical protein
MKTWLKISAVTMAVLFSTGAWAQPRNPVCPRLEAQLASLDRGNNDPTRADQIRRSEQAVGRQQFEVDRLVAQARRMGCENSGFFSIFSNPPPQCGALNRQIDQQRATLDHLQNQFEQMQGGTTERAAQRQSLLIALSDNNCGPQYRSAAQAGQQGGFFDRLFGIFTNNGNNEISNSLPGPVGETYRTVCVRTCDGYYFPVSFATTSDHFNDDAQACQHMCPAAEVTLYTHHNPGEEIEQAVSLDGRRYTELPAAFQYRKALSSACSCRRQGESWADALKVNGTDTTIAPGDVVVTEKTAKRLSQPRTGADGKPIRPDSQKSTTPQNEPPPNATSDTPIEPDAANRKVRTVGPTFLPAH